MPFVIDDLAIAALIASAAATAANAQDAARRQKNTAMDAQKRAISANNLATDEALKRVQEFDPGTRQEQQQAIQTDLTDKYEQAAMSTPITAQGVQVGETIPTDAGSGDYLAAKARETAKAVQSSRNLAQLFGRIGSAGELRRKEAVGIGDTASAIGRIGDNANRQAGIDQIAIQAAGVPSLGGQLASAALSAYGTAGLASSAAAANSATAASSLSNPSMLDVTLKPGGGNWLSVVR